MNRSLSSTICSFFHNFSFSESGFGWGVFEKIQISLAEGVSLFLVFKSIQQELIEG
jgi:hypothetical protein